MAYEHTLTCITLRTPSTAYSTYQYRGVMASSSENYFKIGTTGANSVMIGILQDAPTVSGESCNIAISGISKAVAGSTALKPGDRYVYGTNGVIASSSEAVAKAVLYGPVITGNASTGNYISVMINRVGITT